MLDTIKKQLSAKTVLVLYIIFTSWWIYLRLTTTPESLDNQLFAASYGLLALFGGIIGISIAQKWGGFKSLFGRSIYMFSFGLLAQEFGQLMYSYYIYFSNNEVPYPSWGDLGYFGSIILYILGVYFMGRVVKANLGSFKNKIQAILIPILMLVVAYLLFLSDYEFDISAPLKIFLDFGYPFGQTLYVSLAILVYLLSKNLLGGIMKNKILFILFALVVQFLADYTFLYQASRGTWYAGGLNDFIYLTSYFMMTFGLIQLKTVINTLRS